MKIDETVFQRVSAMNEAFKNPKGNPLRISGPKLMSQVSNILKEYEAELLPAIKEGRVDDIRDALADIIVFAFGGFHFMGYDGDRDLHCVIDALYSRFCRDTAHLEQTKKHFDGLGVKYYIEGQFPTCCLKSLEDQGDGEYPKGKFLKAMDYHKPVFYQVTVDPRKFFGQPGISDMESQMADNLAPATKQHDVVTAIAAERALHMEAHRGKLETINKQVEAFRADLERKAFGFEPFDGQSNNTAGSFNPPNGEGC